MQLRGGRRNRKEGVVCVAVPVKDTAGSCGRVVWRAGSVGDHAVLTDVRVYRLDHGLLYRLRSCVARLTGWVWIVGMPARTPTARHARQLHINYALMSSAGRNWTMLATDAVPHGEGGW